MPVLEFPHIIAPIGPETQEEHEIARGLASVHFANQANLPIWVVCDNKTSDMPGVYVARMHFSLPTPSLTSVAISHKDLNKLRGLLPPGLVRLDRRPEDEKIILETWL